VFEWDPRKADANAAKHGVSFDEAVTVFSTRTRSTVRTSTTPDRTAISAAGPVR
jgi:uncharacterized DUF497 family protein